MESRRIPLEMLEIARPCAADWDAMTGGRQSRFCDHCRKSVYDLSAMPRDEAERLVCEAAGSVCVRFHRAADGTVVTLDYRPERRPSRGWRFWAAAGAIGGLLVAAVNAALPGRGRPVQGGTVCVMGAPPPLTTMPTTAPATTTLAETDADESSDDGTFPDGGAGDGGSEP